MPAEQRRIQVGHISLPLYRHAKGWRFAWKDPLTQSWRYGTRKDRDDAVAAAHAKATELAGQQNTLQAAIRDPETALLFRRVLQLEITHADLDRLQRFRAVPDLTLSDAVADFLAAKEAARGRSARNLRTLKTHTGLLTTYFGGDRAIATITSAEIEAWMAHTPPTGKKIDPSPVTRRNRRNSAVTLWRWARKRKLLPDEDTAAELAERPLARRKVPATWTPDELAAMLRVCPGSHLPWLTLSAFGGFRESELYHVEDDDKDPLRWSDIRLSDQLIEVRPETDKNGYRRLVPIVPALAAWLETLQPGTDPAATVCTGKPAYREIKGLNRSATAILGDAVGGWKVNALRHSWISYRAAQVGLAQTATEAGNSESEARKSYNDAKSKEEADQWFALSPAKIQQEV